MDVLMVTPEVGPLARESRLGDVVAGLSKTLVQNGHQVTIAAPRYPAFEEGGLLVARRLTPLTLEDGAQVTVFDGQLATGVKVALFDADDLYARPGIYADGDAPYENAAERFGMLCRAATALVAQRRERREAFDVVHAFDWPAAPVGLLLRSTPSALPTVLTVTAPSDRGEFPLGKTAALGLDRDGRELAVVSRKLSFLAAGLRTAELVSLSSAAHARDVLARVAPAQNRLLEECGDRLTGVPDGIDYSTYNPATDATLKSRFDAEDVSNKGTCKTDVVRSHGLELEVARPLVVAVAHTEEDGKRLGALVAEIGRAEITLVIAGRGAESARDAIAELGPRAAIASDLDGVSLRKLMAGADIALLPQSYPIHAFEARVAERYGAVPVAIASGAIQDAVVDCDAALQTGSGFLAGDATQGALVAALQRALAAYASERWPTLRRRVMRLDVGWDRPARRYLQLYRQVTSRPAAAAPGS